MARQRRSFSPEFKRRVAQEVISGQSQASVARRYELSRHLIPLWKKAYQTGRFSPQATGGATVEELLQDQRIKAEIIQEQAQQIHLLRKAVSALKSSSASNMSTTSGKSSRSRKPAS